MPFLIFLHYTVKVFDDKKKESWILRGEKRIQILLSAWMLNANEFNLYLYYIKKCSHGVGTTASNTHRAQMLQLFCDDNSGYELVMIQHHFHPMYFFFLFIFCNVSATLCLNAPSKWIAVKWYLPSVPCIHSFINALSIDLSFKYHLTSFESLKMI